MPLKMLFSISNARNEDGVKQEDFLVGTDETKSNRELQREFN
jgi:hypothetical protein